jgi:NAD-dependent dihydropyrimidine dehydrogenase PreA subunit
VVVDSGACVGCGHCLQTCPNGVFTLSGGKAVASNADACTLCGRCVQACTPQAVTLNG